MITINISALAAVFFVVRVVAVYLVGLVTIFWLFFPHDVNLKSIRGVFWIIINVVAQLFIWNIVHIHWVS